MERNRRLRDPGNTTIADHRGEISRADAKMGVSNDEAAARFEPRQRWEERIVQPFLHQPFIAGCAKRNALRSQFREP